MPEQSRLLEDHGDWSPDRNANRIVSRGVSPVGCASPPQSPAVTARSLFDGGARGALAYCLRRKHLRRTTRIAFVVGLLLTAVNQGAVIVGGDASTLTWVRCAVNFLIPFVVSNLGLLSGRGATSGPGPEPEPTLGSAHDEH